MRNIKGRNTRPELIVRRYLFKHGFRYRLHKKSLPGTPDIVLARYNTVIFINGCFWHGHKDCPKSALPKSRINFWEQKIKNNIRRDNANIAELSKMGWGVVIIHQCELSKKNIDNTMNKVIDYLRNINKPV